MAVIQAIADAQTRVDAAVTLNSQKVDALIAQVAAGGTGATPAEQQAIADHLNATAAAVEAINARS